MSEIDLSLWHETNGNYHTQEINGWYSCAVYPRFNGMWYWEGMHHDGWDGEQLVDEIIDESEQDFPTWQEAALDCEANCKVFKY